jgi:hypothetical protein
MKLTRGPIINEATVARTAFFWCVDPHKAEIRTV